MDVAQPTGQQPGQRRSPQRGGWRRPAAAGAVLAAIAAGAIAAPQLGDAIEAFTGGPTVEGVGRLADWVVLSGQVAEAADAYLPATVYDGQNIYLPGDGSEIPGARHVPSGYLACPQSPNVGVGLTWQITNRDRGVWNCRWTDGSRDFGVTYDTSGDSAPPSSVEPVDVDGARVWALPDGTRVRVARDGWTVDWYAQHVDGTPITATTVADAFASEPVLDVQRFVANLADIRAAEAVEREAARKESEALRKAESEERAAAAELQAQQNALREQSAAAFLSQLQAMDDDGALTAQAADGSSAAQFVDTYRRMLDARGTGGDGVTADLAGDGTVTLPVGTYEVDLSFDDDGAVRAVAFDGSDFGDVTVGQYSGTPEGVELTVDAAIVWPDAIWLLTRWATAPGVGASLGPWGFQRTDGSGAESTLAPPVANNGQSVARLDPGTTVTMFDAFCCDVPFGTLYRFVDAGAAGSLRATLDVRN